MERNDKVTTDALRSMRMGAVAVFDVADANAINSGKALAYRLQHILGCDFKAQSDYANNRLIITKLPKT